VSNILNLRHSVLPGFRLSFGITLFWLALIVLLPLPRWCIPPSAWAGTVSPLQWAARG
jgi:sulfate transport system permease protein